MGINTIITKDQYAISFISLLITISLFLLAGNLIFVEKKNKSLVSISGLEIYSAKQNDSGEVANSQKKIIEESENSDSERTQTQKIKRAIDSPVKQISPTIKSLSQNTILSMEGDYFPLFKPKPDYPKSALERGYEGSCLVEYDIEKDGRVSQVNVVETKCDVWFESTSMRAAKSFIYKPRIKNGKPQRVEQVRNKFVYKIIEN